MKIVFVELGCCFIAAIGISAQFLFLLFLFLSLGSCGSPLCLHNLAVSSDGQKLCSNASNQWGFHIFLMNLLVGECIQISGGPTLLSLDPVPSKVLSACAHGLLSPRGVWKFYGSFILRIYVKFLANLPVRCSLQLGPQPQASRAAGSPGVLRTKITASIDNTTVHEFLSYAPNQVILSCSEPARFHYQPFPVRTITNWTDGNSSKQECHRLPLFLLKRPAVFSIHCLLLVDLQSLSWLVLTILSIFIGFSCGGRWFVYLLTLPYQSIWYC